MNVGKPRLAVMNVLMMIDVGDDCGNVAKCRYRVRSGGTTRCGRYDKTGQREAHTHTRVAVMQYTYV